MHCPDFLRLEARWRALHYLALHTDESRLCHIRVLNVSKAELIRDLKERELLDSTVYEKVYLEAAGSFGAQSFTLLVGDYEFGPSMEDVALLRSMSRVADLAAAPFIAGAAPAMFGLRSYSEQRWERGLRWIFEHEKYGYWREFRASPESRFAALVLPRVLLRTAYEDQGEPGENFQYRESLRTEDQSQLVWGNPAYFLAARIADSFARYGTVTRIVGAEDGRVTSLPVSWRRSRLGDLTNLGPTECLIADSTEFELAQQGFVALCQKMNTGDAYFFAVASCYKPRVELKTRGDTLSARLQYVLLAARFAQCLRLILQSNMGMFRTPIECERHLNKWIRGYVSADANAGPELRLMRPLADAAVSLAEDPSRPGLHRAKLSLRPHQPVREVNAWIEIEAPMERSYFV